MTRAGIVAILIMAFIVVAPTQGEGAKKKKNHVGVVRAISGRVDVLKPGWKRARRIKAGYRVSQGDIIRTKSRAKAEISFKDGSVVNMAERTRLTVSKYVMKGSKREKGLLKLFRGKIKATVSKSRGFLRAAFSKASDFEVMTPSAIVGVKGTVFYVSLSSIHNQTSVHVSNGAVSLAGAGSPGVQVTVKSGFRSTVGKRTGFTPVRPAKAAEGEFGTLEMATTIVATEEAPPPPEGEAEGEGGTEPIAGEPTPGGDTTAEGGGTTEGDGATEGGEPTEDGGPLAEGDDGGLLAEGGGLTTEGDGGGFTGDGGGPTTEGDYMLPPPDEGGILLSGGDLTGGGDGGGFTDVGDGGPTGGDCCLDPPIIPFDEANVPAPTVVVNSFGINPLNSALIRLGFGANVPLTLLSYAVDGGALNPAPGPYPGQAFPIDLSLAEGLHTITWQGEDIDGVLIPDGVTAPLPSFSWKYATEPFLYGNGYFSGFTGSINVMTSESMHMYQASGAPNGLWQSLNSGDYSGTMNDVWDLSVKYMNTSLANGVSTTTYGTQWSGGVLQGTTYGYGHAEGAGTWITVGDTSGTFDPVTMTWQSVQSGIFMDTNQFLGHRLTAEGQSLLASLNIPFAEVGRTTLTGTDGNLTVTMNDVTFFAHASGLAPKIWATNNVTATYGTIPMVGAYVSTSSTATGLWADFTVKQWSGGTWSSSVYGSGVYTGAGTMNDGTMVGFEGEVNGTYSGGTANGAGAGIMTQGAL